MKCPTFCQLLAFHHLLQSLFLQSCLPPVPSCSLASGLESHLWWHKPDLPMRSIWLSPSLSRTHTRHCSQQCRWQMRRWILRFMPSALSGSCQDIKTQHIKLHANPDTNRQSTNPETTIRLSWCWTVLRHRFSSQRHQLAACVHPDCYSWPCASLGLMTSISVISITNTWPIKALPLSTPCALIHVAEGRGHTYKHILMYIPLVCRAIACHMLWSMWKVKKENSESRWEKIEIYKVKQRKI